MSYYSSATTVKKMIKNTDQYVRILKGEKEDSVAKIIEVKHVGYRNHKFYLEIKGYRKFWMDGYKLFHIPDYNGETTLIKTQKTVSHKDTLGRDIRIGTTIIFSKSCGSGGDQGVIETIIGNVHTQSPSGALWVKPIKITNKLPLEMTDKLIRLSHPERSLILDRNTMTDILLYKLCN